MGIVEFPLTFLASLEGEVASAVCAEVGGVKYNLHQTFYKTPQAAYAAGVSLRLGHATALTVHRTVIHYRVDTSLP